MSVPDSRPVQMFRPRGLLANPHVQSLLASGGYRRFVFRHAIRDFLAQSVLHTLDCGHGTRLQGFFTGHQNHANAEAQESRGLMVLIHGWEGSANSTYLLCLGARLVREGFDVFRLNLRDHGDTQHLNPEIFHSNRIDEVVAAVAAVAAQFAARPMHVCGFSLGGNFALRIALRAKTHGLPLARAFAICPAISPPAVLGALEDGLWIYHAYFMKKWRRSLRAKQKHFPELYQFEEWIRGRNMRDLTAELVRRHTEYESLDAYLDAYSLHGERLSGLPIPVSILTAEDDPIIPIDHFHHLQLPVQSELTCLPHGGHCGFIANWAMHSHAEDFILQRLAQV